jgi:hypothetical protein
MTVCEKGLIRLWACCSLFVALSLPLILRKVPRNPVCGYRTRATLGDDGLRCEANACFGRWCLAASLAVAGLALMLDLWRGLSAAAYLTVSVGLLPAPAVVAGFATHPPGACAAGGRLAHRPAPLSGLAGCRRACSDRQPAARSISNQLVSA